ncbi:partial Periplasmic dipeptide transport protein, partial [Anaerolineae bacterium]
MCHRLLFLAGVLALLLAACAPAATPAPVTIRETVAPVTIKETVVVEKTVQVQVPVTPTPGGVRKGGTLIVPFTADVNFNSILASGPNDSYIQAVVFNGLVRYDKQTWEPVPDLAERWETSSDGLTWTFYLRKGVKWHDGKSFTANDVKFTYDRGIFDPNVKTRIKSPYEDVKEIKVVDDNTVQFVLKQPYAGLAIQMGSYQFIVPKHILDGKDLNTFDDFNKKNP